MRKNTNKGITLITLVITIVVLTILAGVSINAVVGDDGIIAKARENANTTKETSTKEAVNRLVLEYQLAKTDESLEDFLKAKVPGKIDKVTNNGDGTLTIEKDEVKITVDATQNSTSTNPSKPSKPSNSEISLDDLQIGDYVNYSYDPAIQYSLTSKYCGDSSQITQTIGLRWQVINIDKNTKTVDIVSENPTVGTVTFLGILGYNNGPYFMNEICKMHYSNGKYGTYARSINLLDMEKHLTESGIAARNEYKSGDGTNQYGKTITKTGNYSYYPALYQNQKGAGIDTTNIVQPDITKGNDPYEESKPIANEEPTTDSSRGQASSNGLTATSTFYTIPINEENYGNAASILLTSRDYFVATRFVSSSASFATAWGLRGALRGNAGNAMCFSSGQYGGATNYLRPLVTLRYDLFTGTKDYFGAWNLK